MDILGQLSGGINREQVIFNRIKTILSPSSEDKEDTKNNCLNINKEDAKFIQLHFKNKCPKYHSYFGDYNIEMLQKLCNFMVYKTYEHKDVIYSQGAPSDCFYYILSGNVHIIEINSEGQEKIANFSHENQIFGLNKDASENLTSKRDRTAISEKSVIVLQINTEQYENIRKQRVLSAAETKIEFLTQYIPGLRSVSSHIIHELETIFQMEKVTKGFRLIEQGIINDFLYFILSGECRLLYNYVDNKKIMDKLSIIDQRLPKYISIGKISCGDILGQTSALTKTPCKYSVQVISEEAVLYKISWSTFYENFGKDSGKPVKSLRGKVIMDSNWVNMIIKKLGYK